MTHIRTCVRPSARPSIHLLTILFSISSVIKWPTELILRRLILDIGVHSRFVLIFRFPPGGAVGARLLKSSNRFAAYTSYVIELKLGTIPDISPHNRSDRIFRFPFRKHTSWDIQIDSQPKVLILIDSKRPRMLLDINPHNPILAQSLDDGFFDFSPEGAVGACPSKYSNWSTACSSYSIELKLSRMILAIRLHNCSKPDFSISLRRRCGEVPLKFSNRLTAYSSYPMELKLDRYY